MRELRDDLTIGKMREFMIDGESFIVCDQVHEQVFFVQGRGRARDVPESWLKPTPKESVAVRAISVELGNRILTFNGIFEEVTGKDINHTEQWVTFHFRDGQPLTYRFPFFAFVTKDQE